MMLAETIASNVNWSLIATIVMAICTAGLWWDARRAKPTVISPQPLTVEVARALHEQFADREEVRKLFGENTARHSQLFKAIEKVKEDAKTQLDREVNGINADRTRTMEKLNDELTFIRESLSAINTELRLNREKKNDR